MKKRKITATQPVENQMQERQVVITTPTTYCARRFFEAVKRKPRK